MPGNCGRALGADSGDLVGGDGIGDYGGGDPAHAFRSGILSGLPKQPQPRRRRRRWIPGDFADPPDDAFP